MIKIDWTVFKQSPRDLALPCTSDNSDQEHLESSEFFDASRALESELAIYHDMERMTFRVSKVFQGTQYTTNLRRNYGLQRYSLESVK